MYWPVTFPHGVFDTPALSTLFTYPFLLFSFSSPFTLQFSIGGKGVSILPRLATLLLCWETWEQSHPITLYKAHIKIIDRMDIPGIVQSPSTSPYTIYFSLYLLSLLVNKGYLAPVTLSCLECFLVICQASNCL